MEAQPELAVASSWYISLIHLDHHPTMVNKFVRTDTQIILLQKTHNQCVSNLGTSKIRIESRIRASESLYLPWRDSTWKRSGILLSVKIMTYYTRKDCPSAEVVSNFGRVTGNYMHYHIKIYLCLRFQISQRINVEANYWITRVTKEDQVKERKHKSYTQEKNQTLNLLCTSQKI